MTALPTLLIVGFAIGLFLAAVIVGYRIWRPIATRQLEPEVPGWVNRGNDIWLQPTINTFIDAVNATPRERQLEDSAPWN